MPPRCCSPTPAASIRRPAANTFRVAASDYLDPQFLPQLVSQIKSLAPLCQIEIHPLSADSDYHAHLAQGDVDVVVGNWLKPPEDLHLGKLFADEVVCLVSSDHPAVRRGWTQESWLEAEHIAPTPTHPGARGVIDDHLEGLGLARNITARCPHFGLIPRHGGIELAGADHRPPVLRALRRPAAGEDPANARSHFPQLDVLPAVARAHPRLRAPAKWLREQVKRWRLRCERH